MPVHKRRYNVPQHLILPVSKIAQECVKPAATLTTAAPVPKSTLGRSSPMPPEVDPPSPRVLGSPVPICPYSLFPKHCRRKRKLRKKRGTLRFKMVPCIIKKWVWCERFESSTKYADWLMVRASCFVLDLFPLTHTVQLNVLSEMERIYFVRALVEIRRFSNEALEICEQNSSMVGRTESTTPQKRTSDAKYFVVGISLQVMSA